MARVCDLPLVLVVHPSLPVKTLPGTHRLREGQPDKLSHPSSGNGTLSHVAMEELKAKAGIRILHVPYQGSPPAMNDLVAGTVQVAMDTVTVTKPHIDAGRMRLIAVSTLETTVFFSRYADHRRAGIPRLEASAWLAVLLPAQTPADKVKRLSDAVVKVVGMPEIQKKFLAAVRFPTPWMPPGSPRSSGARISAGAR